MTSIPALLTSISEANPTGPDLSISAKFDQIAELRRFADPTLDQGEWVRDIKVADWPGVARLCAELLSTGTKDLPVALTQSSAHVQD